MLVLRAANRFATLAPTIPAGDTRGRGEVRPPLRRFSVGVIGAGAISRLQHLPVLTSMPQVRVVWVADAEDDRARSLARAHGVKAIALPPSPDDLPQCDAVLLAIPVGARAPYLQSLAQRGIGAFVEKPFARTAEEQLRLLRGFPPHKIACGFMRRTYDSTFLLRTILDDGWFGPPVRIRISEGARATATRMDSSYFDDPQAVGGGILAELGCHAIDVVLHLLAPHSHEVLRQHVVFDGHGDRKAEAEVALHLGERGEGERVHLEFCISHLDAQDNVLEIEFPTVRLVVGNKPASVVRVRALGERREVVELQPLNRGARTFNQAFYLQWEWFLRGLEDGQPSPVAAASCLPVTSLIEDVYRAARA